MTVESTYHRRGSTAAELRFHLQPGACSAHQDLACHEDENALRGGRVRVQGADVVLALLERQRSQLRHNGCWPLHLLALHSTAHGLLKSIPDPDRVSEMVNADIPQRRLFGLPAASRYEGMSISCTGTTLDIIRMIPQNCRGPVQI